MDPREKEKMDQESVSARFKWFLGQNPKDGREWHVREEEEEDGMDLLPNESLVSRGEGYFSEVKSFQGFAEREVRHQTVEGHTISALP